MNISMSGIVASACIALAGIDCTDPGCGRRPEVNDENRYQRLFIDVSERKSVDRQNRLLCQTSDQNA